MYSKLLVSAIAILSIACLPLAAQNEQFTGIEKYKNQIVEPTFDEVFKKEDDRKNFTRLREYYNDKEQLVKTLSKERDALEISFDEKEILFNEERIKSIDSLIKDKKPADEITVSSAAFSNIFNRRYVRNWSGMRRADYALDADNKKVPVNQFSERRAALSNRISEIRQDSVSLAYLRKNIDNVEEDIAQCKNQIDTALTPVLQEQKFKTNVSIAFIVLIGILLVSFFFSIFWRSDGTLADELLSGNGLQFVTLFVLIIAIVLFGILGILQGSELAAILSGISGYILGKGNQHRQQPNQRMPEREQYNTEEQDVNDMMNVRKPQAGGKARNAPMRE